MRAALRFGLGFADKEKYDDNPEVDRDFGVFCFLRKKSCFQ